MTAYTINIAFTFPNNPATGQPDPLLEPTVDNSTSQRDNVANTYDSIKWTVSANTTNRDGLEITGIEFFTGNPKSSATRVTPAWIQRSSKGSDGSYEITFKDMDVADTTYVYNVLWDDLNWPNEKFDPTLEIKPRIKKAQAGEAGGG